MKSLNSKLKVIGEWIYYLLITLVILIMINSVISRSDKIFNMVGFRAYAVLTGSMEPEIMAGDLAIVKSVDKNKLDVNDIITFKYDGYNVTHRIVEKKDEGFVTKGDNNNVEDKDLVKPKDVIGEVKLVIPNLGYVLSFISKPFVIVGLLLLLALIILKETFLDD